MKKHRTSTTTLSLITLAALCMAITMPSCPGQQAMQQQIDELKVKETDLTRKLVKLEGDHNAVLADVGATKTLAGQMGQEVQALKARIDALEAAVKVLQTPPPAPAKGGAKKKK